MSVNGDLCCFVWSRPKQFGCIPMHHFCEKCLTPSCRAEKERSRSQEVRKHACFVTCVLMHSTRASIVVCVIATVLNTDKPDFLSLVPLSKKLLSVGNAPRFFLYLRPLSTLHLRHLGFSSLSRFPPSTTNNNNNLEQGWGTSKRQTRNPRFFFISVHSLHCISDTLAFHLFQDFPPQ